MQTLLLFVVSLVDAGDLDGVFSAVRLDSRLRGANVYALAEVEDDVFDRLQIVVVVLERVEVDLALVVAVEGEGKER